MSPLPQRDLSSSDSSQSDHSASGDDLIDHAQMVADYQHIPELDTYGSSGVTDSLSHSDDPAARLLAEQEISRQARIQSRLQSRSTTSARNRFNFLEEQSSDPLNFRSTEKEYQEIETHRISLEELDFSAGLNSLIKRSDVITEIKRRFRRFLTTYSDKYYLEKIHKLCSENKRSLYIEYTHLRESEEILALFLADEPEIMFSLLSKSLEEVILSIYNNYIPSIVTSVFGRVKGIPVIDALRDLRSYHLSSLIRTDGVITRRSIPSNFVVKSIITCKSCLYSSLPSNNVEFNEGLRCEECGSGYLEKEAYEYSSKQQITLQELPDKVPAGRVPRSIICELEGDLVDSVKPGERVDLIGVLEASSTSKEGKEDSMSMIIKNKFPVLKTKLKINSITSFSTSKTSILDEEITLFTKAAKQHSRNMLHYLIQNFAPSINYRDNLKRALIVSIVSGVKKSKIRGSVHFLMVGDPSTAKSQLLKYSSSILTKSVYTSGKGASAAGLTASVHIDKNTKEFTLEGGALVMADSGVCCIDEFEKMNDNDRTSIHEAMEQQTISISKAGIIANLKAECSILAASNPVGNGSRYDASKSINRNVGLGEAILSRFDIILPVRDVVNPVEDSLLANKILKSHASSNLSSSNENLNLNSEVIDRGEENIYSGENLNSLHKNRNSQNSTSSNENSSEKSKEGENQLESPDWVGKYLEYVKTAFSPSLSRLNKQKLSSLYSRLRKESYSITHSIRIAVRHIESIIRIAEACAKIRMSNYVEDEDLDMSIEIVLNSFISGQKFGVKKSLGRKFNEYLHKGDEKEVLMMLLNDIVKDKINLMNIMKSDDENLNDVVGEDGMKKKVEVRIDEFEKRAREGNLGIGGIGEFLNSKEFDDKGFGVVDGKIVKEF